MKSKLGLTLALTAFVLGLANIPAASASTEGFNAATADVSWSKGT
ncbi:MAG TPA: hypothetical protein PKL10_13225 [Nitrospira sp.]|nr:hypothetical protein [Nitrospira sp.]